MDIPPIDPSPLMDALTEKWADALPSRPSAETLQQMNIHLQRVMFAISHNMRVYPPENIPQMPTDLLVGLNNAFSRIQSLSAQLEQQPLGYRPDPLWKLIQNAPPSSLSRTLHQIKHDAKLAGPLAKLGAQADRLWATPQNLTYMNLGVAALVALSVYVWKKWPDPSDLLDLNLPDNDIYYPLLDEDFEDPGPYYIGGSHRYRHYDINVLGAHSGEKGMFMWSAGETDEDQSYIYIRWNAPPPILDKVSLFFFLKPSAMPRYADFGISLRLPLPDCTIAAFTQTGWMGTPGWWYTMISSLDQFIPHSFGLSGRIRTWGTCRIDIDLTMRCYTRVFTHSADMISYPLPTEVLPQQHEPLSSLAIYWFSKGKDGTHLCIDDVLLVNHGSPLPHASTYQLTETLRNAERSRRRTRRDLLPLSPTAEDL